MKKGPLGALVVWCGDQDRSQDSTSPIELTSIGYLPDLRQTKPYTPAIRLIVRLDNHLVIVKH